MAETAIHLTIVTPERSLVDEQVEELQLPGAEGYLGILPGHAPLFSELKVGELGYRRGSKWVWLSVAWGFAEVLPDQVRVLAETAERANEIELERATEQGTRRERLSHGGDEVDYNRALVALERAVVRIQVVEKLKAIKSPRLLLTPGLAGFNHIRTFPQTPSPRLENPWDVR
jgi:F-type H+-transporting ATPase subunit epsilon